MLILGFDCAWPKVSVFSIWNLQKGRCPFGVRLKPSKREFPRKDKTQKWALPRRSTQLGMIQAGNERNTMFQVPITS